MYGSIASSFYRAECQIRTLGIWWLHQTTLYTNVTTELGFYNHFEGPQVVTTQELNGEYPNTQFVERSFNYVADILTGWDPEPYFNSYNGSCYSNAGVGSNNQGKVSLICN